MAEPAPSSGSSSPEKDQQAQADLAALHASHRELKATHDQLQTELQQAQQQLAQAESKEAEQAGSAAEKATAAADKTQQELQAAEDKSAKLSHDIAELRKQSKGAEEQLGTRCWPACVSCSMCDTCRCFKSVLTWVLPLPCTCGVRYAPRIC